jgi:hypothetical protein
MFTIIYLEIHLQEHTNNDFCGLLEKISDKTFFQISFFQFKMLSIKLIFALQFDYVS